MLDTRSSPPRLGTLARLATKSMTSGRSHGKSRIRSPHGEAVGVSRIENIHDNSLSVSSSLVIHPSLFNFATLLIGAGDGNRTHVTSLEG